MELLLALGIDLVAIAILAYLLYFRRHRRRDLMLSYVALNTGVFSVTMALGSLEVGIGVGIGLFGILSIIRLRSDQISQQEIAYYFVALVLGLICGLRPEPFWTVPLFATLLLLVMLIVDSPRLGANTKRLTITLDRAVLTEEEATVALEKLLGASVVQVDILSTDLVSDLSRVDVRYTVGSKPKPRGGIPSNSESRTDDSAEKL